MKYAILFSSQTGNTARLAEALREYLPQKDCVYFGAPDEQALSAPIIFTGFWTDKGSCDETTKAFLKTLRDRQLFLFGTAGFGGNAAYFEEILKAVKANIDTTVSVMGDFMCQGKMSASVLERYEKMLVSGNDCIRAQKMIENFHSAASHPDQTDLENLKHMANKILKECRGEKGN